MRMSTTNEKKSNCLDCGTQHIYVYLKTFDEARVAHVYLPFPVCAIHVKKGKIKSLLRSPPSTTNNIQNTYIHSLHVFTKFKAPTCIPQMPFNRMICIYFRQMWHAKSRISFLNKIPKRIFFWNIIQWWTKFWSEYNYYCIFLVFLLSKRDSVKKTNRQTNGRMNTVSYIQE